MLQDKNDMKFCDNCKMNVFPARPEFNTLVFSVIAGIMVVIVTIYTFLAFFTPFFQIIFFLYLFMFLNPYLIYYGLIGKKNCPKCRKEVVNKNLDYEPFGSKKSEGLPSLSHEKEISKDVDGNVLSEGWFCPYCGSTIKRTWINCKKCGKTLNFNKNTLKKNPYSK